MKADKLRDMSKYPLIEDCDFGDQNDKKWLLSETDGPDKFVRKIWHRRYFKSTDEYYESANTETAQKFICVNGPLAGQMVTEKKAEPYGYCSYNCAHNAYRTKGWARVVLVCDVFLTPTGMVKMSA